MDGSPALAPANPVSTWGLTMAFTVFGLEIIQCEHSTAHGRAGWTADARPLASAVRGHRWQRSVSYRRVRLPFVRVKVVPCLRHAVSVIYGL
jgi:hypothetical protein